MRGDWGGGGGGLGVQRRKVAHSEEKDNLL